ncbi:MAG: carbohydrate porin [Polyangia bacterium]
MRRTLLVLGLSGLMLTGLAAQPAFAQGGPESETNKTETTETEHNTEEPKAAETPSAVITPTEGAPPPSAPPPARPKFGDMTVSGYFRGGFGASSQKGRMTCFQLAIPGNLFSKYRLGNECEVWSETHFTFVTYAGDDGTVSTVHFMPTIFIPTWFTGYTPTGVINSPARLTTSTGATIAFPNLYVDLKGVPELGGGTAWIGTRYYKREFIYISDFFYWNPSGVGAGVEDINLGQDLRLSVAVFAVDGEPQAPQNETAPPIPAQFDFGFRPDIQLRGITLWPGGEIQLGFQAIINYSNDPSTHSGWGATIQIVQKLLGGDNKLAFQYGKGGGTGFGTLARFYYPDFSVRHDLTESRVRAVDVFTIQPTKWYGQQIGLVYQHDSSNGSTQNWYSAGSRISVAPFKHLKFLGEAGYDRVTKSVGSKPQFLAKVTGAIALSADRGLLSRPEFRIFYTWATWNAEAAVPGIDSARLYTDTYPQYLSGSIFGVQAETWW